MEHSRTQETGGSSQVVMKVYIKCVFPLMMQFAGAIHDFVHSDQIPQRAEYLLYVDSFDTVLETNASNIVSCMQSFLSTDIILPSCATAQVTDFLKYDCDLLLSSSNGEFPLSKLER